MRAGTSQKSETPFTELCERHKARGFDDREYLCSDVNDVRRLYGHNPLVPDGNGADALTRRLQRYETAAKLVKQALADQYGADLANNLLAGVERETGRDLGEGMTRGDLELISHELRQLKEVHLRIRSRCRQFGMKYR